jgi:hypothetical protein
MRRLQRRRAPIERIRVPLLCHQTNLSFVAVFMRSGRRVWFDHTAVTNQGRSPTGSVMDLDPPRVFPRCRGKACAARTAVLRRWLEVDGDRYLSWGLALACIVSAAMIAVLMLGPRIGYF